MNNTPSSAKEINEKDILVFLSKLDRWGCLYDIDDTEYPHSLRHAVPEGTSVKVLKAKLEKMIKQDLIDGCSCGCRGDWEITEKGRKYLKTL